LLADILKGFGEISTFLINRCMGVFDNITILSS
jgi:hypothetical protein